MQNKLTIALVALAFALASFPAFAGDMPVDGSKNFTAPGDAPSYFTNETLPSSARVANQAAFTEVDEASEPAVRQAATDRGGKRASARKSKGHGGSTYDTKASSSTSSRSGVSRSAGTRSAGAAKASGKSRTPAGASKTSSTKRGKPAIGQQAAVVPPATAAMSFA